MPVRVIYVGVVLGTKLHTNTNIFCHIASKCDVLNLTWLCRPHWNHNTEQLIEYFCWGRICCHKLYFNIINVCQHKPSRFSSFLYHDIQEINTFTIWSFKYLKNKVTKINNNRIFIRNGHMDSFWYWNTRLLENNKTCCW